MKVLIVSDIHGNWPALQAVLAAEPDADRILCLGDLVDYGPMPVECVAWAMESMERGWLVQGNHDWAVGVGADPQCSPAYRLLAAATQQFSQRVLSTDMKRFLAGLIPLRCFEAGGAKWAACHAVPSEPLFHYALDASDPGGWALEVEAVGSPDFLFVGHTHLPMKVQIARTLVINPGSVGQPKDGDPRAAYALWKDGDVSLQRAAYPVAETARAFSGLPLAPEVVHALCEVLRTGGRLS